MKDEVVNRLLLALFAAGLTVAILVTLWREVFP